MNKASDNVLNKVRKLLAMSKDTSSPNEAATAARMARKLIDQHQIDEVDLTSVESNDMGVGTYMTGMKTAGKFNGVLSVYVAKYNDCQVKLMRCGETGLLKMVFEGMLVDAVCATEMFKYLRDEGYKQAVKNTTGRANRHAYRMGFASGVGIQVKAFLAERNKLKTSTGTSLVVCKQALVKQHFTPASYSTTKTKFSGSYDSYSRGLERGKDTSLNRQVRGEQRKRLAG